MAAPPSKRSVGALVLLALTYLVVGVGFAELGKGATSHRAVVAWRWAAWLISGVAFAAHVGYERLRQGRAPAGTALHASLAVALGASALAAAALIRSLVTGTGNPRLLALALVAWPALAAIPAFLVARTAASLLTRWAPPKADR